MKNKSDAVIALSVIVCSVILLGALFFAVAGNPFQKPYLTFSVDFEDLTGIRETSAVLYAGDKVGNVERIEHIGEGDRLDDYTNIRAYISITKDIAIPANVDIEISSESLLGEKHISLKRIDDEEGFLADGSHLSAAKTKPILEQFVPGSDEIVENLRSITSELKQFTEDLDIESSLGDLEISLTNIRQFTDDLNTLLTGELSAGDLHAKLSSLVINLEEAGKGINTLVVGPEGSPEQGLNERSAIILSNLETFSTELNSAMSGTPDGGPGLRRQLEEITDELHQLTVNRGGDGISEQVGDFIADLEKLMSEMQTVLVWSEYIAGTLAEKPSRIVWGTLENNVPTKEEILEHYRTSSEPFPVKISELENDASLDDDDRERRNPGLFRPPNSRE